MKSVLQKEKFLKVILILIIFLLIISSILEVSSAVFVQKFIDYASGEYKNSIIRILSFVIFYLLFQIILLYIIKKLKCKYIYQSMIIYKEKFFDRMIYNDKYDFKSSDSGFISNLTNDIKEIETKYISGRIDFVTQIFFLIGSLLLMIKYNLFLTIITVILSFIPMSVYIFSNKYIVDAEKNLSLENGFFTSLLKNILDGLSVIKVFSAENYIRDYFIKKNNKLEDSKRDVFNRREIISLWASVCSFLSRIGSIIIGCVFVRKGEMQLGAFVAFIQLTSMWIVPLQSLPQIMADISASKALINKHNLMFDNYKELNNEKINNFKNTIDLINLSYSIDNNFILKEINYSFKMGKKYAIVGPSGSGKTTLLRVLSGMERNFDGDIVIDDIYAKSENLNYFFPIMQQNVFLFNDTIKNNIMLNRKISDDRLNQVLTISGLNEIVETKGIDYHCGENGENLSGGEKQRVSLARCIIEKNSLLLFDEATSSLDFNNEYEVVKKICEIENMSCISVIHSTNKDILQQFDEILVLNNGTIIENGNYDNLIKDKKYFYAMNMLEKN